MILVDVALINVKSPICLPLLVRARFLPNHAHAITPTSTSSSDLSSFDTSSAVNTSLLEGSGKPETQDRSTSFSQEFSLRLKMDYKCLIL
ncbi:unnamed protein product [Protopolystoma xenopodis]|uniref:Uncharacterized protein n=1 Tax=Protopolystoma xenopodis TaxID=117903 RepID=A0A448WYU6_9PLAT|nr:unnamed protein product [Protopolystoma xenopodis]